MKKVAFIKNNIVGVALNTDDSLVDFLINSDLIIDISNNTNVESGWSYDGQNFIEPQPYPSWTLDNNILVWMPPVEMPQDGKQYTWDENSLSWLEVNI